jgi:ATP/maltotriose-dependent transcriptional regulator MalT
MSGNHRDSWYLSLGVNAALQIVGEQVTLEERARLLGAEDALCKKAGADQNPWERVTGEITSRLREHPQQQGWDEAFQEGQSLTFDDVVARTLAMLKDFSNSLATGGAVKDQPSTEGIVSERELEVLQLVARGLSSKVIGKRLFISVSTVNYHLTSIFNKLGVDTRAQAVAEAARRGVLSMAEPDA